MDKYYNNRSSYPFYTSDGKYTPFTQIIDDMVVWVDDTVSLPLQVSGVAVVPGGRDIILTLEDQSKRFTYTMDSRKGYIEDIDRCISGIVKWDNTYVQSVASTLLGMDPIPWSAVYVLPVVCVLGVSSPLSSVYINGNISMDNPVVIRGDGSNVRTSNSPTRLNVYQVDESLAEEYINRVVISVNGSPDKVYEYNDINGTVILRSDAECNLRVITDNSIHITDMMSGD